MTFGVKHMQPLNLAWKLFCLVLPLFPVIHGCGPGHGRSGEFQPIYALVERTLPGHADAFRFESLSPSDDAVSMFELSSTARGEILIRATDKSAAAKGLYYYLRHYLKGNISRCGSQIPDYQLLPAVKEPVAVKTKMPYRYYFNYCTFNYSMSFWSWEDWEQEIDWMALQGINLSLAIVGTEAVWQQTLRRFGFSEKEILDFIPGPAYTAWWLMDNLEGWGGPVSQEWIDSRVVLQQKIVSRMRELGMEPVLPAFYGMAPNLAIEKFPDHNILKDVLWGGIQRPAFIDPRDSLFNEMGTVFYQEQEKLYGKARFYSGDPFHEGGKKMVDLTASARIIQALMQKHSPGATWILQGWQENPTDALLAGTDKEHTLVLDLCGEGFPWYAKRDNFNDHHFLWCNINNFGGNTCMFARFDSVANVPGRIAKSRHKVNFKGIGMMMEGSFTDPIVYDLFFDVPWTNQPMDLKQWLHSYSEYRYGHNNADMETAIRLLSETVYNAQHRTENILCARPNLDAERVTTWAPGADPSYNQDSLLLALHHMANVDDPRITNTATYQFDLANLARQATSGMSYELLQELRIAYREKNIVQFKALSGDFLNLILVADSLVSQMPNFSFYKWQQRALAAAPAGSDKNRFLWNANRLVTLWSNKEGSSNLHDYGYREWYGLLSGFYYPRWKMYFDYLLESINDPRIEPIDFYRWEDKWCNRELTEPEKIRYDMKQIIERHFIFP
jgi:alpha-N-acetylglucosaminidase